MNPIAKDDRDLGHGEPVGQGPIGQLDLEGVPLGADGVEVDRLEHLPAEALEAAGQIADPETEH